MAPQAILIVSGHEKITGKLVELMVRRGTRSIDRFEILVYGFRNGVATAIFVAHPTKSMGKGRASYRRRFAQVNGRYEERTGSFLWDKEIVPGSVDTYGPVIDYLVDVYHDASMQLPKGEYSGEYLPHPESLPSAVFIPAKARLARR